MEKFKELLFLKNIKGIGKKAIYTKYWNALNAVKDIQELRIIVEKLETRLTAQDIDTAMAKSEKTYHTVINDADISVITTFDENYPKKLNVMGEKRPPIVYVKGNLHALDTDSIAIIGTRSPSEWSQKVERKLVSKILELSDKTIVSGLALGCDQIAHEETVNRKKITIGVLPSGVNVITPASNKKLAEDIIKNQGCLISEYEPDEKALMPYFVERDAIVAALSDITFVVECDVKSGTMHTVDAAKKYSRLLACYYPEDLTKGSYNGNEYMLNNKDAIKVKDTEDLKKLLKNLNTIANDQSGQKEPKQLSLLDFADM